MGEKSRKKKAAAGRQHQVKVTGPKISVCLIAKNEEKYLDQCLKSVVAVADEIIFVDTGSTDRTLEIARKYTDKIWIHPWQDSFSEARNHYLNYATGEWIFQIDADEELVQEDIPNLLEAVRDREVDGIMVQIVSKFSGGKSEAVHSVERLFRNNGVIHYEGRVHNRVVGMTNARVYPIRMLHYGYDINQVQTEKKFARTVSLLKMDLEDNPENPITYHYLSCSYLSRGMYREALEASLTAIRIADLKNDGRLVFLWSHYNAGRSYYHLKDLPNAEKIALAALKRYPKHIDSHFILIMVYFEQKRWAELMDHGSEYIRLINLLKTSPILFDNLVTSSVNEIWNIYVLIGIGHFELSQYEEATEAFERAASLAPEPFVALRATGIYYFNKKEERFARTFLERAKDLNPADETVKDLLGRLSPAPPSPRKEPTLSCCLIVKNEAAFLEQCLNSIKDHVDEIIIVDTGSTDETVEIARRFTDKLYFHPWENSFSKARNQALAYATGDWVFTIDADEELLLDSGEKLRQAIRGAGNADAILVNIISTYSSGNKTARHNFERLFKNNGIIHYEGIVHNRVVGATAIKASRIELMHYGYNVEEKKANEKFLRTTELLKQQIREEPDNPMPHHYLGTSYLSRGQNREALSESLRAIELADQQHNSHPLYLWTHHNAAMAFFRLGDLEQARHYSVKALEIFPGHLDSLYALTMIAAEKGEWTTVLKDGEKFISRLHIYEKNPEEAGLIINATMKEGPTVHLLLGHACHAGHRQKQMTGHYRKAWDEADEKWQVWWNIGAFHLDRSGDLDLSRKYLELALAEAPEAQPAWYMLAKLNKKCQLFDKERHCLEQLFRLKTDDLVALNRLATLCIKDGDLETALAATQAALAVNAANYPALCNLGLLYQKKNAPEKALATFLQAVEIHPYGAAPWISLGEISQSIGRLDEAKTFFERALFFQTGLTDVLLRLCDIEFRIGAIDDFVHHCEQLLKELGLSSNRTLNSREDIAVVLLEIALALRGRPEAMRLTANILSLLSVDYNALSLKLDGAPLASLDSFLKFLREEPITVLKGS